MVCNAGDYSTNNIPALLGTLIGLKDDNLIKILRGVRYCVESTMTLQYRDF